MNALLQAGVNTGVIDAAGWLVVLVSLAITVGWLYQLTS
jgi:hypothetical protein